MTIGWRNQSNHLPDAHCNEDMAKSFLAFRNPIIIILLNWVRIGRVSKKLIAAMSKKDRDGDEIAGCNSGLKGLQ